MVYWYIVAHCEWLGPNFGQAEYIDMNGYTEGTMGSQKIESEGEIGDPFLSYGIDTQTWAYGQAQMEIGLIGSHRIRINSSGVRIWTAGDVWKDPLTEGGGGGGHTYVPRGNLVGWDKDNFIADATWRDWDISAIVPAGTVAVVLRLRCRATVANNAWTFRPNGATDATYNICRRMSQVANQIMNHNAIVAVDANRVLEYNFTANSDYAKCVIRGWFV